MRHLVIAVVLGVSGCGPTDEQLRTNAKAAIERNDPRAAVAAYTPLAEKGDAKAQYALGQIHEHFLDDETEAFQWYEKSAKRGYWRGLIATGDAYLSGNGVQKNEQHGATWLKKGLAAAPELNVLTTHALFRLAFMHLYGEGVPRSKATAHILLNLSAMSTQAGREQTLSHLRALEREMSREEIAEAESKALSCHRLPAVCSAFR